MPACFGNKDVPDTLIQMLHNGGTAIGKGGDIMFFCQSITQINKDLFGTAPSVGCNKLSDFQNNSLRILMIFYASIQNKATTDMLLPVDVREE